jgi:hypothetical protein
MSDDPKDAIKFAESLKTLAQSTCSMHLQQKALFRPCEDHPEPSWDNFFRSEFDAATKAMRVLEQEMHSAIERQQSLVSALELRATLLRVKADRPVG